MSDSRASTTDEKVTINDEKGTTAHRDNSSKGFFSRRKSQLPVDEKDEKEKNGDVTTEVTPAERVVPPISFTQLFRYPFSFPECLLILTNFFFLSVFRRHSNSSLMSLVLLQPWRLVQPRSILVSFLLRIVH